jgi:arginine exporter protein ArgO
VSFNIPRGALPTAVLQAATITASFIWFPSLSFPPSLMGK